MVFFLAALPYAIAGTAIVGGVLIYMAWGAAEDAVYEAAATAVEDTGLILLSVLYSGYVLVFGFPGYLIDSGVHGMIDAIDQMRFTSIDYVSSLDIGNNRTTFYEFTDDNLDDLTVLGVGSPTDDILGKLFIKGTYGAVEFVHGNLVNPGVP